MIQNKTDEEFEKEYLGWRVWLAEEVQEWRENNEGSNEEIN